MDPRVDGEMGKVCDDLIRERLKCTFKTLELTHIWDGGEAKTQERRDRQECFLSDPLLKDDVPLEYLSHKEQYEHAIRKVCIIYKKLRACGSVEDFRHILGGAIGSAVVREGSPMTIHYVMFVPTLMGQGTADQQACWLSRAWNLEIIGTYAQTELGHGTFVRGLETTATYDPQSQEFVLNSPSLTSFKWWPGGLGHTANYAIVMAQLYTQNKCQGIHSFIVQLRDELTHEPMPGIVIGEIGAKMSFNTVDNGYLGFKHVRIPRENMLMKNNQVLEDGTYMKSPSDKLTYGTMIFVRVIVGQDMSHYLSQAVTIATRYSAVRHQSEIKSGEPEPQILDYVTQQHKIFPSIAACFAMHFTASWLWDMYNIVTGELDHGNLRRLPELHALSCCLKALYTKDTSGLIETLRLACGGHGYMKCSNLPGIYGIVTAACTYEGENTVLFLQTARFLIKSWQQTCSGQAVTPSVAYMKNYLDRGQQLDLWENNMKCVCRAFYQVAAGKVKNAAEHMAQRSKAGMAPEDAWNRTSIELVSASIAYCRAFTVEKFAETVSQMNASESLSTVLIQLVELYSTFWILEEKGGFLMFTNMTQVDMERVQLWYEELLEKVRPNAVGLVDSFDIRDEVLHSALGAWDGRVYERLFEEAQKSPLNHEPVNESFHKYLKPLIRSGL